MKRFGMSQRDHAESTDSRVWTTEFGPSSLPFSSCVTLGSLFNLLGLSFVMCEMVIIVASASWESLEGLNETTLAQCLADGKSPINGSCYSVNIMLL